MIISCKELPDLLKNLQQHRLNLRRFRQRGLFQGIQRRLDLIASDSCGRNVGFVQPWGIPQTIRKPGILGIPKMACFMGERCPEPRGNAVNRLIHHNQNVFDEENDDKPFWGYSSPCSDKSMVCLFHCRKS